VCVIVVQGMRDYAEQQRRLLADIATYTARNLSILAGTASPSSNDHIVPFADVDLPEAVLPPGLNRPTLTLSKEFVAGSESLESPAYVPTSDPITSPVSYGDSYVPLSDIILSPVSYGDTYVPVSDVISSPVSNGFSLLSSDSIEALNISSRDEQLETGSDVTKSCECVPSSLESVPTSSEPALSSSLTAKTNSLAASVRRKFTVTSVATSKPSDSLVPVVLFTKTMLPNDCDNYDDGNARVCFPAINSADSKKDIGDVEIQSNTETSEPLPIISQDEHESRDLSEAPPTSCEEKNESRIPCLESMTSTNVLHENSQALNISCEHDTLVSSEDSMSSPAVDVLNEILQGSSLSPTNVTANCPVVNVLNKTLTVDVTTSNYSSSPVVGVVNEAATVNATSDTTSSSVSPTVNATSDTTSSSVSPTVNESSDTTSSLVSPTVNESSDTTSSLVSPTMNELCGVLDESTIGLEYSAGNVTLKEGIL